MPHEDDISIAVLTERVSQWMVGTDQYRSSLCTKMNDQKEAMAELKAGQIKMFQMMYDLPCKAREEKTKSESKMQMLLWTGCWVTIGAIAATLAAHLGWK